MLTKRKSKLQLVCTAIVSLFLVNAVDIHLTPATRGKVTEAVTRGKVMNKVPNFIEELELYPF